MTPDHDTLTQMWEQSKGESQHEKLIDFASQVATFASVKTMATIAEQRKEHETVHDLAAVLGPMVKDHIGTRPEGFVLQFVAGNTEDGGIGFTSINLIKMSDMIAHTAKPNRAERRRRGSRGMS